MIENRVFQVINFNILIFVYVLLLFVFLIGNNFVLN